jgi:hypothetical protein
MMPIHLGSRTRACNRLRLFVARADFWLGRPYIAPPSHG